MKNFIVIVILGNIRRLRRLVNDPLGVKKAVLGIDLEIAANQRAINKGFERQSWFNRTYGRVDFDDDIRHYVSDAL